MELKEFYHGCEKVRAACIDGQCWFAGVDVARNLLLSPVYSVRKHVSEANKKVVQVNHGRRTYNVVLINIEGMGELCSVFGKKPHNKWDKGRVVDFVKWLGDTVAPILLNIPDANREAMCEDAQATEPDEPMEQQEANNMKDLQIFNYEETPVRVVDKDGAPWWVLADVCRVLELSNPSKVAARLDDDEKNTVHLTDGILDNPNPELGYSRRGNPNMTIINESGLYKVILRSDKPEAKKFTRWVTHEVLPSIRKTGSYQAPGYDKSEMEYKELTRAQHRLINQQQSFIEKQSEDINIAKQLILYYRSGRDDKKADDAMKSYAGVATKEKPNPTTLEETIEIEKGRMELEERVNKYASTFKMNQGSVWTMLRRILDKQYGVKKLMAKMKKSLGLSKMPTLPEYLSYSNEFPLALNVIDAMIAKHSTIRPA